LRMDDRVLCELDANAEGQDYENQSPGELLHRWAPLKDRL